MRIKLRQGLDLPLEGAPRQEIERTREPDTVGLFEHDLPRGRHALRVAVGDRVEEGQALIVDRSRPELVYRSPAAGLVVRAQRSEGHEPLAVVVEVEHGAGSAPEIIPAVALDELLRLERDELARRLLAAGEWPALRVRPLGGIPNPGDHPDALFIRAMDTNPLAAKASVVLRGRMDDLRLGVAALSRLLEGPVFVGCDPELEPPLDDLERIQIVHFEGPHPAGLVGTHIHHLFPLRTGREVWTIGYQDVLAIGHLFRTGRRELERVIALAGPIVRDPRLLRVRIGANSEDLLRGELLPGECRIVSGSLFTGRRAASSMSHLGLGHEQLLALPEVDDAGAKGWSVPGLFGPRRVPPWRRPAPISTALHGEPRAMLPLPIFEAAFPLRLPIGLLLRALAARDVESARRFGALELEEEDLALCTYLCPAKLEYGGLLRDTLDRIGAARP